MTREEAIKRIERERDFSRGMEKSWGKVDWNDKPEHLPDPRYFSKNHRIYADALDMAISALREQPRWISVEDRLPVIEDSEPWDEFTDDRGYVFLVADEDGYVFTATFWIKANRFGDPTITHWMPLPEPPKEEV